MSIAYDRAILAKQCADIIKFAKRWCPVNWRVWHKNVKWFLKKQVVVK